MKKFFTFLFFISFISVYSQSVDPLTGRASVSIPLGSISAYDLGVNVNLSHHGGAIGVNDGPGNAGMGWQVVTGGYTIFREVRGLPDDVNTSTRKGWLYNNNSNAVQGFTPSADDNLAVCTDEATDWTFINGRGYNNDTEPDIFYFSAPGIGGKFIFGSDGLPKLIPYQDLKITFSLVTGYFTIETSTGLVYTFDVKRSSTREAIQYKSTPINYFKSYYNYYQPAVTYTSAWDLSSVSSKSSGVSLEYDYMLPVEDQSSNYITTISPLNTTVVDTLYQLQETVTYSLLTDITLKNYNIHLSWGNRLIEKISINESETLDSKQFDFVYRSVSSSLSGQESTSKPFLDKVRQQRNCISYPSYEFRYIGLSTSNYTLAMPWKTGWGEDHFGYYNGQDANKNIPTVYQYSSEAGARRLRVTPIPGGSPSIYPGPSAGSRNVNSAYTSLGALQKIIYPTGGVVTYTYEANKYWDSSTSEELDGPGIRVANVTVTGGEYAYGKTTAPAPAGYHTMKKTYQYKITDNGNTSGTLLYPPAFAFVDGLNVYRTQANQGPGSEVMYSRVKELVTGKGYTVYLYDMPNVYPDVSPVVPSSKIARASGGACSAGSMKNGVYTFPFAPIQDLNYKRGLLRKVSEYTDAGALTNERRINYIEPQTSSTIKGLKFEEVSNGVTTTYHYSSYLIPVSQSRIVSQEIVKSIGEESQADSVRITTTNAYNTLNRVTQSTQTNSDGSIINSYMKYAGDFVIATPTGGDVQASAIKKLNDSNRSGQVVETWQTLTPIGGSAVVTSAHLNLFKESGAFVWPDRSKAFPQGKTFTSSAVVPGPTQGFSYDSDYVTDGTFDYVDALPVNQTGTSLITSSVHYSTGLGLPIASFINCKAENAVFEGFELISTHGLSGGATSSPGWTGQKAMPITSSTILTSGTVTKSENKYRVSLWANATTSNINISVKAKNGATVQATLTLNYPTANQWIYLEGFLDMSQVSSSFTFEVSSPTAITIDEFTALPQSARVSSRTFLPLTGPTSETDDRGNSNLIIYDLLGRPNTTFDSKRNLVGLTEYNTQITPLPGLKASFTSNAPNYGLGAPVTFTGSNPCISGVTYNWTFTSPYGYQTTASGVSVMKSFNVMGKYAVKLDVSKAGYNSESYTQEICVTGTDSPGVTVTVTHPSTSQQGAVNEIFQCDPIDDWDRVFTATLPGVPHGVPDPGPVVIYTWYITDQYGAWHPALDFLTGVTVAGNVLAYDSPQYSYQVRCDIKYEVGSNACDYIQVLGNGSAGIVFHPNSQCQ